MPETSLPQVEEKVKCAIEWCHEEEFRRGLCFWHFVEEENARWDDQDAERQMCLKAVGYIWGDPLLEEVTA